MIKVTTLKLYGYILRHQQQRCHAHSTLHLTTLTREGRCTTHLAFKVVEHLKKKQGAKLVDYPLLIRLNPNIPWKTRGNGAVCLRLKVQDTERVIDYIRQAVEEGSAIGSGFNPAIAFLESDYVPTKLRDFSALQCMT